MAADLAALVRSKEIVEDVGVLESVAAAELDIPSTSFDTILQVLESAELVELTRRKGQVTGLTSGVPHYRDLYSILGREWREREPSQLEEELLAVVDQLAKGPVAAESLTSVVGIEENDVERVLSLGSDAELIKSVSGIDGTILYSPYAAFENPKMLTDMAEQHGNDRILEEFSAVREHQGLAVTSESYPMLWDAIGRGLIIAPSIELPGSAGDMPFATLPYTLDRELLMGEKPVLEKVLAIIACVRCGEKFGGYSNLVDAAIGVNALLKWGELEPHSSSARQYRLMRNKGIITFGPDRYSWGRWVTPTLVDTPENRRALEIAHDLLTLGETLTGREAERASQVLSSDARYIGPLKTIKTTKPRLMHKEGEYAKIMAAFMGYGTLG